MMNSFPEMLGRLLSINQNGGMKLGLDNCHTLNKLLGNPIQNFLSVHVAGSNGKGSVSTKIARAYELEGRKVGLYTSPHIASWRERIKINGVMISEEEADSWLARIFALIDEWEIPATFFEITTMLAFAHFAQEGVDIVVAETGLGGRLDATNILKPILCVITSISLDHTEILGHTLEAIAREKAGIIKEGVPVLIGSQVPLFVIEPITQEKKCLLAQVQGDFDDYLEENAAIAAKALGMLGFKEDLIAQALNALPSCRMENINNVILDVAHNPDGIQKLFTSIHKRFPGKIIRVIVGLSKNKDVEGCLRKIDSQAEFIYLVEGRNDRAMSRGGLAEVLLRLGRDSGCFSTEYTIANAIQDSKGHDSALTLVCGTFFIMQEAREALGIVEPTDRQ